MKDVGCKVNFKVLLLLFTKYSTVYLLYTMNIISCSIVAITEVANQGTIWWLATDTWYKSHLIWKD